MKKLKRILTCLFGGRRKFQVTKFAFEDFIFVIGSAANSLSTTLEFAAFHSRPDAKCGRDSDLLVVFFFCRQPWFLRRSEHIFPGKTPACSCPGHLLTEKETSSKINSIRYFNFCGLVVTRRPVLPAEPSSKLSGDVFFSSLVFFLCF